MSNLNPTPGWDDVPQLEQNTRAQGGPGGPMNSQAQALLDRTELLREERVSILDYVNKSDIADIMLAIPTRDYTYALAAAVNALPPGGGTVDIPASVTLLPCNYVLTKSGVTLRMRGQQNWLWTAAAYQGLVPFDPTKPVLQVGSDTGYVVGTRLENVSISNPSGAGSYGLKLSGGVYGFQADGLTCTGFNVKSVWLSNGQNYPCTFVSISNFAFNTNKDGTKVSAQSAAFWCDYIDSAVGPNTSFTTGISLSNGSIAAANHVSRQIWLDGVQIWLSGVYVQCSGPNTGIMFARTGTMSPNPQTQWANGSVDAGSFSVVAAECNYLSTSNTFNYIQGSVAFTGAFMSLSGVAVNGPGAFSMQAYAAIASPMVLNAILFPTNSNYLDTSANIQGTGAAGARQINHTGQANFLSGLAVTGGTGVGVTISYAAPSFYLNDSSGSGGATIRYQSAGTQVWSLGATAGGINFQIARSVSGVLVDAPVNISNSTGSVTFSAQTKLANYTVATLPTVVSAGQIAYASNGRKAGEASGAGTGVQVYYSNSAWRVPGTDAAVAS